MQTPEKVEPRPEYLTACFRCASRFDAMQARWCPLRWSPPHPRLSALFVVFLEADPAGQKKVIVMTSLYTGRRYREEAFKEFGADGSSQALAHFAPP